MLKRILEPELMDTVEDAREYDAMDHASVNEVFVTDLLAAIAVWTSKQPVQNAELPLRVLDLGAGTVQIPIELAYRSSRVHITAVDAAENMLALARMNVTKANLSDRIELALANAKNLPFADGAFDLVISNSIVHHIPEPYGVVAEAIRVTTAGGLLFHRDLARPSDEAMLNHLVNTYAAGATIYQRRLFAESLHAALTAEEMTNLVSAFGFARDVVQMTSDRHWTWLATKK